VPVTIIKNISSVFLLEVRCIFLPSDNTREDTDILFQTCFQILLGSVLIEVYTSQRRVELNNRC